MSEDVSICQQFGIEGELTGIEPWGDGHIHDTWRVNCRSRRYILQRINQTVFHDPVALMDNMQRVTEHLRRKQGERNVQVIAGRDGRALQRDANGGCWRLLSFVEGTRSYPSAESPEQAFEAARAFGRFLLSMADLPGPPLTETIPHFHDTLRRHGALEKAIAADDCGRVAVAEAEIAFALKREREVSALMETPLPARTTHNDTKLDNVLFDEQTGQSVCVVDLDTVMTGTALYDFGDLIRGSSCPAAEDELDLSQVAMDPQRFQALARGYFSVLGDLLTAEERRMMVLAGKLITYETGIRFLTDYLVGDTYFKIHREHHNLDRCRTQFKLVESIEQQEAEMERFIARL